MTTRHIYYCIATFILCGFSIGVVVGCGAAAPVAKTVLDIVRGPAVDVLTKVIADRYGSDVDQVSAYCEELPTGFRSGIDELDDNERGAFVMCWGEAAE